MDTHDDHTRPHTTLTPALARAAVWGGLTLIDPNRQTGWRRHAYWLAMAAATAWEVGASRDDEIDAATKTGIGVGLAGATYGAKELLAKSDAWTVGLVARVDPRRPRLWLALLAAGTSLASSLLDRSVNRDRGPEGADFNDTTELSPHVRGLLVTMLDSIDGYGSQELRAQIEHTQMVDDEGVVYFVQDGDAPQSLIKDYVFPARVEFDRDDRTHIIELVVEDGWLGSLNHYADPAWEDGEPEPRWDLPAADELRVEIGQ